MYCCFMRRSTLLMLPLILALSLGACALPSDGSSGGSGSGSPSVGVSSSGAVPSASATPFTPGAQLWSGVGQTASAWFDSSAGADSLGFNTDPAIIRVGLAETDAANTLGNFTLIHPTLQGSLLANELTAARLFLKVTSGPTPTNLRLVAIGHSWSPPITSTAIAQALITDRAGRTVAVRSEPNGWVSLDVTPEVRSWVAGEIQNNGLAILPAAPEDAAGTPGLDPSPASSTATSDPSSTSSSASSSVSTATETVGSSATSATRAADSGATSGITSFAADWNGSTDAPHLEVTGTAGTRDLTYGKFAYLRQPTDPADDAAIADKETTNCLSYALRDTNMITADDLKLDYVRLTQLARDEGDKGVIEYVASQVEAYVTAHQDGLKLTSFRRISGFDAQIDPTKEYRIALRIGAHLTDAEDSFSADRSNFDYHLWLQANDGQWAQKFLNVPTGIVPGTPGGISPDLHPWDADWTWGSAKTDGFYTSPIAYFAVAKTVDGFTQHKAG
jgi:hypothetical protein